MNLRKNGRRSAIAGAGAATLTAAALALGPGTAIGAPADPRAGMSQAAEEAIDAARQAAEDAAQAAQDAARAAQDAADQATQATQAAEAAGGAARDSADTADDAVIDATPDEVDWLPRKPQDDLADLQDLPAEQRAQEVEQILSDAVTGEYGEEVENWSERMVDFMDALPRDLQNDLHDVMGMEGDAAQEQLRRIWQGVLDGDYGQDVEMWGRWLQQSFQQWDLGQLVEGSTDTGTTNSD